MPFALQDGKFIATVDGPIGADEACCCKEIVLGNDCPKCPDGTPRFLTVVFSDIVACCRSAFPTYKITTPLNGAFTLEQFQTLGYECEWDYNDEVTIARYTDASCAVLDYTFTEKRRIHLWHPGGGAPEFNLNYKIDIGTYSVYSNSAVLLGTCLVPVGPFANDDMACGINDYGAEGNATIEPE